MRLKIVAAALLFCAGGEVASNSPPSFPIIELQRDYMSSRRMKVKTNLNLILKDVRNLPPTPKRKEKVFLVCGTYFAPQKWSFFAKQRKKSTNF
jgi:hypothetical protein